MDVFQPLDPTAPAVKNKDVALSRAKLPRPSLLRGVEHSVG
jgi:hypothetical protein